jgi:hypothetical protein
MKWTLGFILAALLCGGCAVYTEPYPAAGVYVAPPPAVVVEPGWEYHRGWYHEGWHHRRYWRG